MNRKNYIISIIILGVSANTFADDYFDPSLLSSDVLGQEHPVDLSIFSRPGGGIEGERDVSIYINGQFYTRKQLFFKNGENGALAPEFPFGFFDELLKKNITPDYRYGIKYNADEIMKVIPYSNVVFEQATSKVDISIPQAYLSSYNQLKSDPESWEFGVPAFLMDYRLSGNQNIYYKNTTKNHYGLFNLGVNALGWKIRTNASWSAFETSTSDSKTSSITANIYNTYLEKDFGKIRSTLKLGELNTPGLIMESFSYKGASITSNNEMLKSMLRNYTPKVMGFANSQAVVTIRQNDRVVYQTNVPAGPFELNDFYVSGMSGDLVVTVKESDGAEHSFIQPYSSLPEMKREGITDYNITTGKLNSGKYYYEPSFLYSSLSTGIMNGVTAYGDALFAEKYQSLGLGSTFSLGMLGALSADVSLSQAYKNNVKFRGQSYGLKYSKSQVSTGTTVTLATYRYSTKDYYSFREFALKSNEPTYLWDNKVKNKMSLSLSQSLGNWGYLTLSGSQQEYWTTETVSRNASITHNFSWSDIYFSTAYSMDQSFNSSWKSSVNQRVGFYATIPLKKIFGFWNGNNTSLSYRANKNNNNLSHMTTLTGELPETNMTFSLGRGWGDNKSDDNRSISLDWRGELLNSSIGYVIANENKTLSYDMNGGAVIYPFGAALGSDSVMNGVSIVETPGVKGVKVQQGRWRTSFLGTAIVTSLDYYNENQINLLPDGLPNDIALTETSKRTVPVKGAVTLLKYNTLKGSQVVFSLQDKAGKPLPFGSIVSLSNSEIENTGIVGDEGRVYLAGIPENGKLNVSWGKNRSCQAVFDNIYRNSKSEVIIEKELVCK
ncbi:fimbria/pilus outer membrane usher protein (plasmid) [Escherichia coli]|uniref:fimbria/pilus outer membrane usher protein n=4 Tax=Escherichia coli TaxID=562 RepID=UPI000DA44967|nr:fimbria/pilus outer membrane usher protein [Escherichia coli]MCE3542921.1 fimbrial biogenesis outer membrane usher protein [Escherichia coli]MCE3588452.1 fimbrial biogenesis outer membrane usher protein [Escherichia coli]WMQ65056.1 fimbria/pilus outer membrane usher protein [Escherichia coli]SQZ79752.1 CS12 fimbria outer membrane usher protein [Escherichia coli]